MDELKEILKGLIELKGLTYVAHLLGESKTRNVYNWMQKDKDIPKSKRGMILKILKAEGISK